jgi:hypothetical protein
MSDTATATMTPTPTTALTVELDERGAPRAVPEPLQRWVNGLVADERRRATEKALPDPVERERLRQLESELSAYKIAEAEREKRYEEALKMREADLAEKLKAKDADIARRTQRLADLLGAEVRAAALKHGAREESLEDLDVLLSHRIALDDDLNVVVLGDDGEPVEDGTIDALVAQTLDIKPYFRRAHGTGGGARGGASTRGTVPRPEDAERESAFAAMEDAPTAANLNKVAGLIRQRALRGG